MKDEKLDAALAEIYIEYSGSLSMSEITNLIYQEEEIPYYEYSFDGSDNWEVMNRLTSEEKLGYTLIESDDELKRTVEDMRINGTSLYSYIKVDEIGRDAVLSGYVDVAEYGYLERSVEGPKLDAYTVEEINQTLAESEAIKEHARQEH